MRILFVITGLAANGAEQMLLRLTRSLAETDHEMLVVSLKDEGDLGPAIRALGVRLEVLGMEGLASGVGGTRRLARLIREWRPDVISAWMYHANVVAALASRIAGSGAALVWGIHNSLDNMREKPATRAIVRVGGVLSRSASRIIFTHRSAAAEHQAIGYDVGRAELIPNGFDCRSCAPSPEAAGRLRDELRIPRHVRLIGLLARFHPQKDHDNFLSAMSRVATARSDVRFVLAGPGIDGRNAALLTLVAHAGLRERVHLLGPRRDVPAILAGLDLVCLSSSGGESFPNVVGEAMACGTPCVVTDVADSGWLVGECGAVVPPRDPVALADACLRLLALPESERRSLGAAARARIVERFSIEAVRDAYIAVFERARSVDLPARGAA